MADFGQIVSTVPTQWYNQMVTSPTFASLSTVYVNTPIALHQVIINQPLNYIASPEADISPSVVDSLTSSTRIIPIWAYDSRGYFPNTSVSQVGVSITGTISGQIQEDGTPVSGKHVYLFYRPLNRLIIHTISDSNGNYTFTGLEPNSNQYYVVSLNNLPLSYDAVIHDTIRAL